MTEQEWLTGTDARALLRAASPDTLSPDCNPRLPRLSDRKLRLFACASARQTWLGPGEPSVVAQAAVTLAEQHADNKHEMTILWTARQRCGASTGWVWCATCVDVAVGLTQTLHYHNYPWHANLLRRVLGNPFKPLRYSTVAGAFCTPCPDCGWSGKTNGGAGGFTCGTCWGYGGQRIAGSENWRSPTVLALAKTAYGGDAITKPTKPFPSEGLYVYAEPEKKGPVGPRHGNPFVGWRVSVELSPIFRKRRLAEQWAEERYAVAGWRDGNGAYHQRHAIPAERAVCITPFNGAVLPILADALEEAGCDRTDMLDHLRDDGRTVLDYALPCRGDWVVDLLLGKE